MTRRTSRRRKPSRRSTGTSGSAAPVCLAVVPCAIGYPNPGIPQEHWRSGVAFPLDRIAPSSNACGSGSVRVASPSRCTATRIRIFPTGYEFQAAPDPGAPDRRRPLAAPARARRPDQHLRAAPQRALEARPLCGERRRPQSLGIVPVVPALDATVGMAHAAELLPGQARALGNRAAKARPVRLSVRAALRTPCRIRVSQPRPGDDRRTADPRLRRSARTRRRLLRGHALLGD